MDGENRGKESWRISEDIWLENKLTKYSQLQEGLKILRDLTTDIYSCHYNYLVLYCTCVFEYFWESVIYFNIIMV